MKEVQSAGASRGGDALHNEDRFLIEDKLGLYLVCDGLSERPAGERAAAIAADGVEYYLECLDETHGIEMHSISVGTIEAAIRYALERVIEAANDQPDLEGMASTLTLLVVQRDRGFIGHVGDSRAYLIRRGRCVQLTADQEWTEAAQDVGPRSENDFAPETFSVEIQPSDTFILCTDGAETEMERSEFVQSIAASSPGLIASRIVSHAQRSRPGQDATCVVVRIHDDHEHAWVMASGPPEWLERTQTAELGMTLTDDPSSSRPRFNPAHGGYGRRTRKEDERPARGRRSGHLFA